jgi:hypothetical protein
MQHSIHCNSVVLTWERLRVIQRVRFHPYTCEASVPYKGLLDSNEFDMALFAARPQRKTPIRQKKKQWCLNHR